MRDLWQRIEAFFTQHWPNKDLKLRPPASEESIASAEADLGIRFPEAFRESLSVHDGQGFEPSIKWLPGVGQLGSLSSILECWRGDREMYDAEADAWLDDEQRVRQADFHPRHIPFAGSPHWDYDRLLFDYAPGPTGTQGQIIMRLDVDHCFLCSDWRTLMTKTAEGLESGRIVPVERGPELSHWVEMEYRSPRGKAISLFDYYKDQGRSAPKSRPTRVAPKKPSQKALAKESSSKPSGTGVRRLEYTEGSSAKFWEAEVRDSSLVLRWGKIGTTGQTKTKDFVDPNAARAELNNAAASKLRKGYVEAK